MIIGDVMDEVAAQLDTITGLRVYGFPADSITPPAAVLAYPDLVTFDQTYGRGMDRLTLPVLVIVGKVTARTSRDNLVPYADGSGTKSIKAVVEAGTYTSCDTVRVVTADFDVIRVGGIDYAAAQFDLDITGSGA